MSSTASNIPTAPESAHHKPDSSSSNSNGSQSNDLPKSYVPSDWEQSIRARWDAAKAFHADPNRVASSGGQIKPFCILIPPPNVTAALHLGHAFNNTLQDILVRYHRMLGDETLWMPGTDHAGITTQTVVDKRLQTQGQPSLKDYKKLEDAGKNGREQFVEKVQAWKDEYEATIIQQLKLMGCSCDFDRTRFTMDEICAKAVREAFFHLFKDGLIYRGKRLVNWDPVSQTALADDEVEMEEVHGHMYYLRYPIEGSPNEFVTVATTRPETMLGDTAVAVNPKDPRAAQFVGRKIRLPIVGRVIPIIADDYVVRPVQFGGDENDAKAKIATGFLKVTPAHDDNDYLIGQRHNLPMVNIFAPDATISDEHGWPAEEISAEARQFLGLSREDARKKIVAWFKANNLLEDIKPYTHSVGHSYRTHVPIEPYLSDQWYVKVTDDRMRGSALRAMANSTINNHSKSDGDGELQFFPERYAKTFQTWHENLRDWCISRQIWWGHRIPVWSWRTIGLNKDMAAPMFRDEPGSGVGTIARWLNDREGEGRIARLETRYLHDDDARYTEGDLEIAVRSSDDHEVIRFLEDKKFRRDPDVLDTWFSSALWPISTMGWPEPSAFPREIPEGGELLNTFNPSTVLFTAREIMTLWVSRMVMFNRYFREGKLPFEHVYIHAMIQDGHGQKMSKSLGNGVDPRDIIHSHGADAMRFIMAQIATATQDVRLPVDMMCPHPGCGESFTPKFITTSAGYKVADAIQECPRCKKKMVSGYGAATGIASPTAEILLARNSSAKFDEGRNFANKLWNATRFAISNLSPAPSNAGEDRSMTELKIEGGVDRWIISRLHKTLHVVEDALKDYQFKAYADAMYDFVWNDFCAWYLEAIKPTIKSSPAQQQVLRTVLNAILRLLHPIMPFVTEALFPSVQSTGPAGLPGINLPPSELLARAAWPDIACSVHDSAAVSDFERIQALINAVRQRRSESNIPDKQEIHLHAVGSTLDLINRSQAIIESLTRSKISARSGTDRPAASAIVMFEGSEILLTGLQGHVDPEVEKQRLSKVITEKDRAISGFEAKLSNAGYVSKAPPEKVQETKDLLAKAKADLDAARSALAALS